jgi:RimJ/RimL family protein N-acetyltransferase
LGVYQIDGRLEVEMGYWLGEKHWGNGFATEAARAVQDAALTTLGLSRLISLIDPANQGSLRVAEKNGMRYMAETSFRGRKMHVYVIEKQENIDVALPLIEMEIPAVGQSEIMQT